MALGGDGKTEGFPETLPGQGQRASCNMDLFAEGKSEILREIWPVNQDSFPKGLIDYSIPCPGPWIQPLTGLDPAKGCQMTESEQTGQGISVGWVLPSMALDPFPPGMEKLG